MSRGIDFDGRPWTAKPQEDWLEWAGNPNFPDYLRATFVAHGRQRANGHAPLDREELATYLVRKSGVIPDRRTVYRAVDTAVKLGYLAPESRALCLVLDPSRSQFGVGDPDEKCKRVHSRGRARSGVTVTRSAGKFTGNDGSECRPLVQNDGSECGRSNPNDGNEHRPFRLSPSLSSSQVRQDLSPHTERSAS